MNQTTEQPLPELNERRLLDDFLVDNQELERLDARLRRFNILDVLGVNRVELRHSNILAWLLTRQEPMVLGTRSFVVSSLA